MQNHLFIIFKGIKERIIIALVTLPPEHLFIFKTTCSRGSVGDKTVSDTVSVFQLPKVLRCIKLDVHNLLFLR